MITKTEATQIVAVFQRTLAQRVEAFLRSRARQGFVGGAFVYTPEDPGPIATEVITLVQNSGWTVTLDAPNRTATIS